MREILWFRRDLRISDSGLLSLAKDEVLPIFIFDKHILNDLPKEDKRVSFIYQSVLELKQRLQSISLDLAIFYGEVIPIFQSLLPLGFNRVICSVDFDAYSKKRDHEVEQLIPLKKVLDSFILNPNEHLKKDGTPYKVFTPFYNSLHVITQSLQIACYERNSNLKKIDFDYSVIPSLEQMGFSKVSLPTFLQNSVQNLLEAFKTKVNAYEKERDFFALDATSKLSVHLRFGLISPKEVFNAIRPLPNSECFIKELFWREFYNYILYHFPKSEYENFNGKTIAWNESQEDFFRWCEGKTGIPIIDAAMQYLNQTGLMHNRLRMVVASFLTKNLLIDWKKGEQYFALKLLDYEASSNVGSWQWAASTGADAVPYFRVFNPYLQSKKFDKEGIFIKRVLPELNNVQSKLLHEENALSQDLFLNYPLAIVNIKLSKERAIGAFK